MSTPENLKTGLVLHLPGDISGTTAYDASGNGNNGTMTNVTTQRNNIQKGFSFNGSSSSIAVTTFTYTTGLTNSAWIQKTALGTAKVIIGDSLQNSYKGILYTNTSNNILATMNNGTNFYTLTSTITISAGVLYHIACTYDGATFKLYINGVLNASTAVTGNVRTDASVFRVGNNTTSFFDGNVYNVRSYTRALSNDEIQQLYYSEFIK